ncbi:rhomboid family intramembrane serine protease [Nonomuraea sp. NBC_01738]|uniref:rhomboid family intramembrane serine protease n=1 Tax=Nonomuraea sp. NBC_01738 TaxID=2976003 RepID=UPI002E123AB1|nr:rhomboid family intramembrane serine protease [Nonomuraea sp. NBC_01738]
MTSQPPSPPEQPAEAVPTCYRHPAKETWVRCQRCDRPICPDCMRDAAVGFQCPECVAEGNKGVRQAQATFGGSAVTKPYVTWTFMGLIALVFLGQMVSGTRVASALAMNTYVVAVDGDYYRLLTSAFVHDQSMYLHILFNLWAIYAIAPYLERSFGHAKFAALYLLSALGGSVLGYWVDAPNVVSFGASGAVFGLFAAIFIVGRKQNLEVRGIVVVIALNLALTFVVPLLTGYGISWSAHVGGLVTGAVLSAALVHAPRNHRALYQTLALAGAFVALAALVVIRTTMLLS